MFAKIFKFIMIIISVFLLIFLVSFSFFTKKINSNISLDVFSDLQNGDYSLIGDKAVLGIKSGTKSYFEKIDDFDNIFFLEKKYKITNQDLYTNIDLGNGVYLFDFNNLDKKYTIKSDYFDLDLIGVGKIYIKNETDKVTIFSLSSTLKLDFKTKSSDKILSSIYLFPHDFVRFNPDKNYLLQDADLFRIKSVISSGFIKDSVIDNKTLKNLVDIDFFDATIAYLANQIELDKDNYKKINSSLSINYPLKEYIENYFSIFINPEKKQSYYKNLILNDTILLFKSKEIKQDIVENIKNNLYKLKEVNESGYTDMLAYINAYYKILIKNNDFKNYKAIENFRSLTQQKEITNIYLQDTIYLQNIFLNFDFGYIKNTKDLFADFVTKFFSRFKISDNKILLTNENDNLFLGSFAFYLEKQLNQNLFLDTDSAIASDLIILKNYLYILKSIYFDDKTYVLLNTGLRKNIDLLQTISSFLTTNAFKKQENKEDILEINKDFSLTKDDISDLKLSVNQILSLYSLNKDKLDKQKDALLSNIYSDFSLDFEKYFQALQNYDFYLQKYNTEQSELLGFKGKTKINKIFRTTDILNYLKTFNLSDTSNTSISKIKDSGFRVENFLVSGINFSFDIYPNQANKIENITINGQKKSYSYILDEQKEFMDEALKGASEEDRYKYDFANFFSTVFSSNGNQNIEYVQTEQIKQKESGVIITFKRDKLLGSNGEFASLKGFLDIDYDDIIVKSKENIVIENASLYTTVLFSNSSDKRRYKSIFNSKYTINTKAAKNYFHDINILVSKDEQELFGGIKLNLIGKVDIKFFKAKMNFIFKNIDTIENIYNIVGEKLNSIDYDLTSSKVVFKFEKSSKLIKITSLGENIISFIYNNKEYIGYPIKYSNLNTILKQIK